MLVLVAGHRLGLSFGWRVVIASLASLAIVQFLARGMTSPLRELAAATSAMARGDYGRRVRASSRDEVGELARAFNAMAADLADVDRMRRELVANVSHELRTPLGALQALLENLADGVEPPGDRRRCGRRCSRPSGSAGWSSSCSTSRGWSPASLTLREEPFAVRELLEQATRECAIGAPFSAAPVWLKVSVQPGDLRATGDPERMHQVVANLLENAVRHSPPDGRVWLSAHAATDGVTTIEVADEGPGIPAGRARARVRALPPRRRGTRGARRRHRPRPRDRALDRRRARRHDPRPRARAARLPHRRRTAPLGADRTCGSRRHAAGRRKTPYGQVGATPATPRRMQRELTLATLASDAAPAPRAVPRARRPCATRRRPARLVVALVRRRARRAARRARA